VILEETLAENAWRLEDGLYRILLPLAWAVPFVSVYLVESRGERMLVDAGLNAGTSLRALGRALKAIGVPQGQLDILLLTHRHPDHAAGAGPVQQRWGGRILLHPADLAPRRDGPAEALLWARRQGVPSRVMEELLARRPDGREDLGEAVEALDPRRPISVGTLSFEVIEVPGHSAGQVMLRERSKGWLFTADQVVEPDAPNVWMSPGVTGDPLGGYLESLRATQELEADLILPSHGAPMRGGLREFVGRQIRFQEAYLARAQGLVDAGGSSSWQVAARIAPGREDPSVLAEVLAALTHLQAQGRLGRDGDGIWFPVAS